MIAVINEEAELELIASRLLDASIVGELVDTRLETALAVALMSVELDDTIVESLLDSVSVADVARRELLESVVLEDATTVIADGDKLEVVIAKLDKAEPTEELELKIKLEIVLAVSVGTTELDAITELNDGNSDSDAELSSDVLMLWTVLELISNEESLLREVMVDIVVGMEVDKLESDEGSKLRDSVDEALSVEALPSDVTADKDETGSAIADIVLEIVLSDADEEISPLLID